MLVIIFMEDIESIVQQLQIGIISRTIEKFRN